ncbi:uncharacterized protein PFL1_06245 [Pseudozyma flocculosa PF-1]|uniref:Uncharacterized protein n=1 Tax=Pseudozyma flocculosa PF-1 TaxID=1277687 RepID=A0A061H376_9BASI|nr:uncharacterized protein PFL1_06245 [Pseudozyma flocculosa PF-1]EPQ26310.1 hypothetical protein PFL1_06245 [Pseudozyma flocculosa PF-1]
MPDPLAARLVLSLCPFSLAVDLCSALLRYSQSKLAGMSSALVPQPASSSDTSTEPDDRTVCTIRTNSDNGSLEVMLTSRGRDVFMDLHRREPGLGEVLYEAFSTVLNGCEIESVAPMQVRIDRLDREDRTTATLLRNLLEKMDDYRRCFSKILDLAERTVHRQSLHDASVKHDA